MARLSKRKAQAVLRRLEAARRAEHLNLAEMREIEAALAGDPRFVETVREIVEMCQRYVLFGRVVPMVKERLS